MKESLIREYITNIDFRGDWGISRMKEDMKRFLGEEPGIDVVWEKDAMLNEKTGKPEIIEKMKKISIVFTDIDDKFKKLEFLIQ